MKSKIEHAVARHIKPPCDPVECLLICLVPFPTFLVVNAQGGTGGRRSRPPVYKKSAVTRRLHESEDGMSQAEKTKNV